MIVTVMSVALSVSSSISTQSVLVHQHKVNIGPCGTQL